MTGQLEQRLAAGFRDYAAGVRLDTDVVAAAAARHHRRTNARRAIVAGGVLSVAAALSAVLVLGNAAQPPVAGHRPSATAAPAPALQLAAAVEGTAQTSFRLKVTLKRAYETGRLAGTSDTEEYEGAFDAAADRGYLRTGTTVPGTTGPIELRIIGDEVYTGRPDTNVWKRPIKRSDLAAVLGTANPATSSVINGLTVDPRTLLDMLKGLGGVTPAGRSGSGSTAVDTYTFAYQVAADASTAAHQVTGSVEVGVQSHLLARITQQTTTVGADPAVADGQPLTWRTVIEFAGYGTPVKVDKPAAAGN